MFYFISGAVVDAVEIYTKYVSLNAEHPIQLPSTERHFIEGMTFHSYSPVVKFP